MVDLATYRCRIGRFIPSYFKSLTLEPLRSHVSIKTTAISNLRLRHNFYIFFALTVVFIYLCNFDFISKCTFLNQSNTDNHNSFSILQESDNFGFKRTLNNNFWARYINGNRNEKGIRILHWNKGSSFLVNKKDEIETVIEKYRPHIMGLSEANFFAKHDRLAVQFPEYKMHVCPTLENPQLEVSRVIVYTHTSLIVKPRVDLMSKDISAIWLEIGLPNKRKILVCNCYREWGYLNQPNKQSHSLAAQLLRWQTLVDSWQKALDENKEVILLGDINIDSLKWMKDNLPSSDQIHRQRPLIRFAA